jgi:deoxyribodipyrimidine photo-lyase
MFETSIAEIYAQVEKINPVEYAMTRNFTDGAVTRLSPYISRGVISPKYVLDQVLQRGYKSFQIQKFIQELAWREYFQNVWRAKGDALDEDLKQPQTDVENSLMPKAVIDHETGIEAVDEGVRQMYEAGYAHNHQRMYIASIVCNIGRSHWRVPARWMYYHLLDADWASNALSWQWTAGAFSNKKYYASQENINKYCGTNQRGTFLDVDYGDFSELAVPEVLRITENPVLTVELPEKKPLEIDESLPTLVYNFYNLDPFWKAETNANSVLLLEPTHFAKYPVAPKTIDFILKLAANINGIKVYTGEFDELKKECNSSEIHYKEHPTASHYQGVEEERDWMFPELTGYFPSFFNYWKKCEKLLKQRN